MSKSSSPVAIVTGAGTGIGRGTALRLARDGYTVAVCYSGSQQGAGETLAGIESAGGQGKIYQVSIDEEASVLALFEQVLADHGRVDVVINNAGIGHIGSVRKTSMEDYDRIFGVNARGTFMMTREAARCVEEGGAIVNISTGATTSNMHAQCLYVGSKMALEGFTKVLARELGSKKIRVNVVSPGMTDTPILEGGDAEKLKQWGAQASAMGRCGEVDDIANAIGALVSPDCAWITGQVIHVDGGSVII